MIDYIDTVETVPNPVIEKLAGIDPNELTPKQALEALYELKSLCR